MFVPTFGRRFSAIPFSEFLSMTLRLNRRGFLHGSTAAGLGYLFTGPAFSVVRAQGSNDRIKVAGIGVGGKGRSDIEQAGQFMEVVGLCDIDTSAKHLGGAKDKFKDAETFVDFRKMFDKIGKKIDAAVISTADHTHALAAAMAIKMGKHVYVQKPLTRTVFEAHYLRKLAVEHKVCTQMGNQGTAADGLRRAVELIQSGIIGNVTEVHVWTNRPVWPQAPQVTKRLTKSDVPNTVNWDEFLGPAPDRVYASGYTPFVWRGWWDFGTGAIGDMACHTANMAFMALKLGHPIAVSAKAEGVNAETCPSAANVTLKFAARGNMPPVTLYWYEGKKDGKKVLPSKEIIEKAVALKDHPNAKRKGEVVDSGSFMIGDKGYLYSPDDYGADVYFGPAAEFADLKNKKKPERLAGNNGGDGGQKKEWAAAIKAGKPTLALSNFDYSSYLTAAFLLGNVAIRTGKAFEFDGETLEAKGCPEAAQYIKSEYRKGWDFLEARA